VNDRRAGNVGGAGEREIEHQINAVCCSTRGRRRRPGCGWLASRRRLLLLLLP